MIFPELDLVHGFLQLSRVSLPAFVLQLGLSVLWRLQLFRVGTLCLKNCDARPWQVRYPFSLSVLYQLFRAFQLVLLRHLSLQPLPLLHQFSFRCEEEFPLLFLRR